MLFNVLFVITNIINAQYSVLESYFLYNYDGMYMVHRTVHTTQISCYSVKFIIATCDIMISNIIIIVMF